MPNEANEGKRLLEFFKQSGAILDGDDLDEKKLAYLKSFCLPVRLPKELNPEASPHFLMASGRHTKKFFQLSLAFRYAHISQSVAMRLYKQLLVANLLHEIDVVVGPPMGALPVIYALQHIINSPKIEAFYFEKDQLGNFVLGRGFDIADKRVLLVDDALSTGGSFRKSIDACDFSLFHKKADYQIIGAAVAINRSPASAPPLSVRAPALPVVAAVTHPVDDYDPKDCPDCAEGSSLWKVN